MRKMDNHRKLNIVLGITGAIAAYKSAELIRILKKRGHSVVVIPTENALKFIGEWTLSTLSCEYVIKDTFDTKAKDFTKHISLAKWCDVFVVAPATANFLGKTASGLADNMLLTFSLAFKGRKIAAPCMNTEMLDSFQVKNNIKLLQENSWEFIEPELGELACGDIGKGRLANLEKIVFEIEKSTYEISLKGLKIMVNGGRTIEKIDPVRYISNFSTGETAKIICETAAQMGAEVTYIAGETDTKIPLGIKKYIKTPSADEMYERCVKEWEHSDIAICAAAVSDYTPCTFLEKKIKKNQSQISLNLKKTKDILKELGTKKEKSQVLVGFALESDNFDDSVLKASEKMKSKNTDLIVLNCVNSNAIPFGDVKNNFALIKKGDVEKTGEIDKKLLAKKILTICSSMHGELC